ncbi:hypothetical protein [Myxococcus sp. CA040A]|uniref:hypothetical protein n=1 Tax=Myxococcus sp. CA040A TaxID=2741738 RepID=UPI00157B69F4|nr:hypothetical protein [Myxococcus sp. CA040A]NTX07037.1 hypothetical protein [Myxococcus sp. CA040A]
MSPKLTRDELLARFRERLAEEKQRAKNVDNLRESVAITLRHFIHPEGYADAFELMKLAAEAVGDSLTPDGIWEHGAKGELWLGRAAAFRAALARPESPSPTDPRRPGHLGFTAYNGVVGPHDAWKTPNGLDVPGWDEIGPLTQARWVAAAGAERDEALERAASRAAGELRAAGIGDIDALARVQGAILQQLSLVARAVDAGSKD